MRSATTSVGLPVVSVSSTGILLSRRSSVQVSAAEPPGWSGGFDVVLGNPPWDKVEFKETELLSTFDPDLASLKGSKRKQAIRQLKTDRPAKWRTYRAELRSVDALRHFLARSSQYPLCGRGGINTYAVFAELMRTLLAGNGRVGLVVSTGIATDNSTRLFLADLVERLPYPCVPLRIRPSCAVLPWRADAVLSTDAMWG